MGFISADQLATVAAVADTGSFEKAGRALHVTTSAVSQRVKALERTVGQVLVRRGAPCSLTPAGTTVLRYARQSALLEAEMRAQITTGDGPRAILDLPVAVNADSLATWFPAVFARAATWPDARLLLHVEDEEHTAELLRDGVVLAAVSTDPTPVAGCRMEPLATMTYQPFVRRELLERFTRDSGVDLNHLPVVRYDDKDDLQDRALRAAGITTAVPGPLIPNSNAFVAAVAAGLGWGMLPSRQAPHHADRAPVPDRTPVPDLAPVPGLAPVQRRLHWHRWKLDSPALNRLTQAVVAAAGAGESHTG